MYSFDLTKRYVETMEIDDFLDLFPQSEVLRRLGNLCSCIICAAALYSRNKHIDLFPRTNGNWLKDWCNLKYADINPDLSSHTEAVALLVKERSD